MNDTNRTPDCRCATCPTCAGASCRCGCQTAATQALPQAAGPCGAPCACGPRCTCTPQGCACAQS